MLLVLTAFLLLGYGIHSVFSDRSDMDSAGKAALQEETGDSLAADTSDGNETGDAQNLNQIGSILSYEIPDEIAGKLNAGRFDKELTEYLIQENVISAASGEKTPEKLYSVNCDGLITEDVNHDAFYFDLVVTGGHRQIVTVTAEGQEYTFSLQ